MNDTPISETLEEKLAKPELVRLQQEWAKASARLLVDPEGAITSARSLLETACKHVLEMTEVSYDAQADLPKLYSIVSNELGLAASGHISRIYKQFFGATHTVVQSLGELRNKAGDAHGKGNQDIVPSGAQAELAVHLAGAVAIFLLRTLQEHLTATTRITKEGRAVLAFDKATVWRLVDHAQNAPRHFRSYGQRKIAPGLWLVGDAGIYLMSNGNPPLLQDGRITKEKKTIGLTRLVAYADGCSVDDELEAWWPVHNAIHEGSDFSIPLPIEPIREALERCHTHIVIIPGQESFSVYTDIECDLEADAGPVDS